VIDIDSLENSLKRISIIESYNIDIKDEVLSLRIVEKEPFFCIALITGKETIPYELDREFNIISRKKVFSADKPLVLIKRGDMPQGRVSYKVKKICSLLSELRKERSSIYREISSVYVMNSGRVRVRLRRRKTDFILDPEKKNFIRLNYITGYLDRIKYYPERLEINGDMMVIR